MVGTVTLSLEIELAWGVNNLRDIDRTARFSDGRIRETETLDRILTVCDQLDIPISFDVVGHLLLESCDGEHDGPHAEGWFDPDPGTDVRTDPLFYAPDLVQRIEEADVDHELCTHTFSHVRCDTVGEAVVDWELREVKRIHEAYGLDPPRSFVPPIHGPPPKSVLVDHDIRTVRVPTEYRPPVEALEPPSGWIRSVKWQVAHAYPIEVVRRSHPVQTPRMSDGVLESYTTWHASLSAPFLTNGQLAPHWSFRLLPLSVRQRLHRRYLEEGIREASRHDSAAHFWSHLYNISNNEQWPVVRDFLEHLASRRDEGALQVRTMAALEEPVVAE